MRTSVFARFAIAARPLNTLNTGTIRTLANAAPTLLNVANEIKVDHENVRDLYARFRDATEVDKRAAIANTLIREMAIHSDAEEISVYNEMSKLGMADSVRHDKEEHAEVKRLVYNADSTSVKSDDYDDVLRIAFEAFDKHAKEEEIEQLPLLADKITPEKNDEFARAFLEARNKVPTRPHPWAPQSGGVAQKLAGMQATVHDKVVEKLGGREFVELKFHHAEP